MNNNNLITKQQGMTLIEIMVALMLGAFLLAGVMQIFLSSKQTYRMQDNMSRMQENGRFAMEFISRDIRMAGYQGCSNTSVFNNTSPSNPNPIITAPTLVTYTQGISNEIIGRDNVANNWNSEPCSAGSACIAGTDTISLYFGDVCGNLTGAMATNNANIQISSANTCGIQAFDVLLVSDCLGADMFIASAVSSAAGTQTIVHAANQNTSPQLNQVYGTGAQLFKLTSSTYFIRTGAGGQPALWKLDNTKKATGNNPVELIEGIENMQILYGEDTDADGTPNHYVTANVVTNMNQVVSARIILTVRSLDNNLTNNGDGRLRRTFASTIVLRNRIN